MDKDSEEQIEVFESELDLCHGLLDVAGPKPLSDIIVKARLGYETALLWIGSIRDPIPLRRITAKLDRLRQRLSANSVQAPPKTFGHSAER